MPTSRNRRAMVYRAMPEAGSTLAVPGIGPQIEAIRSFSLVEIKPQGGARWGPFDRRCRLGSAQGNDAVLSDEAVSRFHCVIQRTPDGLLLRDVGSTNGTRVGGCRVVEGFLEDGATLELGRTALRLELAKTPKVQERSEAESFGELVGTSRAMRALFAMLRRLSPAQAPVLIEGETGTGKELVARALHDHSARSAGPFVVVDCGAIAPTLIERELFGHEKGAFTGADESRPGAFEAAQGGTIFLDELGELPLALQPKLLRVLEAKTVKRIGSLQERKVDIRVLAATHRSLGKMINEGRFREDLYFRLAVCLVEVPPLRTRPNDIKALALHFLQNALEERAPSELSAPTQALLSAHPWPGNVRELRNTVERALILSEPERIEAGDLSQGLRRTVRRAEDPLQLPLEESKRQFERQYLIKLLSRFPGKRAEAALLAGIHPKSLQRLLRRHGLLGGVPQEHEEE